MTTTPARRDERSAAFFDAAAEGRLAIKRCTCGHFAAPDRMDCPHCADPTFEWVDAEGTGTLVSWVVSHSRPAVAGDLETRHILALVEVSEGPWLYAALLDADDTELSEGLAVSVDFIRPGSGEAIPAFRPS